MMRIAIIRYANDAAKIAGNGTVINIIEGNLAFMRALPDRPLIEYHPMVGDFSAAEPGAQATIQTRWAGSNRTRRVRFLRGDGLATLDDHPDRDTP